MRNFDTQVDARTMFRAFQSLAIFAEPEHVARSVSLDACAREAFARVWSENGDKPWIEAVMALLDDEIIPQVEATTREVCEAMRCALPDSLAQIEMEVDA